MNEQTLPEMIIEEAKGDFAFEGERTIWPWGKQGFAQRIRVFKMPEVSPSLQRFPVGCAVIDDGNQLTIIEAKRKRDALSKAIEIAEELETQ